MIIAVVGKTVQEGVAVTWQTFEAELKGCPLKMFFVFSGLEAGDIIMEISSKENAQLFSNNAVLPVDRSSFKSESSTSKEKQSCCGGIKVE